MAKKILCLDGGGIRGVFTLTLLDFIEKEVDSDIMNKIDVFGGTSTGALIATGLALGIKPSMMVKMYQLFGKMIFAMRRDDPKKAKYDRTVFTKALKMVFPKDPSFSDVNRRLVIPVFQLEGDDGKWHPEIRHNFEERGKSFSLIDTLIQACAAPMYFPSYKKGMDGGVFALNPSLITLATTMQYMNVGMKECFLLSVGTGMSPCGIKKEIDWGVDSWMKAEKGLGDWPFYTMISEMASFSSDLFFMVAMKEQFFRLTGMHADYYAMDDPSKIKNLIADAKKLTQEPIWEKCKNFLRSSFILS